MNRKMIGVVGVVLMFALINGCAKKTEVAKEKTEKKVREKVEVPGEEVAPGKMSDWLWVDLKAHEIYWRKERMAKEWGRIYKKFGVTEADWKAWGKKLKEDPQQYNRLMEKVGGRVESLKAGD